MQEELAALTQRIYQEPLILSSVLLQRAVANVGDTRSLERMLLKLAQGAQRTS